MHGARASRAVIIFSNYQSLCVASREDYTRHHGARALSQGLKASCRRLSLVSGNVCKTSQGESVTACSLASPQVSSIRMLCAVCHGRACGARLMVTHYRMLLGAWPSVAVLVSGGGDRGPQSVPTL